MRAPLPPSGGRISPFPYPLLMEELLRVEGIIRREAGLDLTFSDGRAGSLRFDLRGLRAGLFSIRIHPGGRSAETALRFNGALIERVGEGVFLPTIAHEYAHAVVFQMKRKAGRNKDRDDFRPHGEIWCSLMVLFGHPPERCHDYPVTPARRGKIFGYRCTDCLLEFRLGTVRHERLLRNPGYLVCGKCRGGLERLHESPAGPAEPGGR